MSTGFGDRELQILQDYLLDNLEQTACMPLDVAHGFLAAVVSGPRNVQVNEWLPPVLGQPDFADEETAESVMELLLGLFSQIEQELAEGSFAPFIIYKPTDEEPLPLPYGWCEGYMLGLGMHGEEQRKDMLETDETAGYLAPLLAFMMYEEDQLLDPPDEAAHRATANELAHSALALFRYWSSRKGMPGRFN